MNLKILSVVGARPNFMKIAPFIKAIIRHNQKIKTLNFEPGTWNHRPGTLNLEPGTCNLQPATCNLQHLLVHTGQHYDVRMSEAFFRALNIPDPDINLEIGSGSHAEQVGQTMIAFEKVLREHRPDWVVVVGDVNATLACSVTAKKEHIRVCHIEAGLRSNDLTMPEEINRLVTDRLSDLLLTPDEISSENLRREGVPEKKIRFVGNIMIDTLEEHRSRASAIPLQEIIAQNSLAESLLKPVPPLTNGYISLTLHRPSNVDGKETLEPLIDFLVREVAREFDLIWPVHPRALKQLSEFGLLSRLVEHPRIFLLKPLGYHEMLRLTMGSRVMLTDSGGLQEECCVLGIPCLTMRWNTERPVTLQEHGGASILVGNDINLIKKAYRQAVTHPATPSRPPLWDGNTAERCLEAILEAGNG